MPILAVRSGAYNWDITFDKPFQGNQSDKDQYSGRDDNKVLMSLTTAFIAGRFVRVTGMLTTSDPGLSVISYNASVGDLIGQNGVPVVAFSDFPIT